MTEGGGFALWSSPGLVGGEFCTATLSLRSSRGPFI
jgi:hypothetical protein